MADASTAASMLGPNLYNAPFYAIAKDEPPATVRPLTLGRAAAALRFVGKNSRLAVADGTVSAQQLQALRQLTPETARLLMEAWIAGDAAVLESRLEAVGTTPTFAVGACYSRKAEIHARFGGNEQSGISPSASEQCVFVFTGEEGEAYGYHDGWTDGVFKYTGEGQVGDMTFDGGNRAIRDHRRDYKALHLFKKERREGGINRYLGEMICAGWQYGQGKDKNGATRRTIVFDLVPASAIESSPPSAEWSTAKALPLEKLREQAYAAVDTPMTSTPSEARRTIHARSEAVRLYVLARARGVCECCEAPAPFLRHDGSPYLEPHHTHRLSDGGPDSPMMVGAICPTCHRRIHSGSDGASLNSMLQERLRLLESTLLQSAAVTP